MKRNENGGARTLPSEWRTNGSWLVSPGKGGAEIRSSARLQLTLPELGYLVLYQGGLEPALLPGTVLTTAVQFANEGLDISVVYVGPDGGEFARMARAVGASVIVRDRESESSGGLFLYAADAVVHASRNGFHTFAQSMVWSQGCCLLRKADPVLLGRVIGYWLGLTEYRIEIEAGSQSALFGEAIVAGQEG